MKTAVYDNPSSFCREAWQDGKLIAYISVGLLMEKGFRGHRRMPFMLNCGEWETGKVWGDAEAIKSFAAPPA